MKKYGTLEKLAAASEADIAQTLHMKADMASDILLSARQLYKKQKAVKEKEMQSLDVAASTKEKAARYKMNKDLALLALDSEEENIVATPENSDN